MRLIDIARDSIKVLQTVGDKGINNIELAKKLNIPRRRIYDIIAILKASNVALIWSNLKIKNQHKKPKSLMRSIKSLID
ncbi:MAG: hypothetical protein ACTSRP_10870 [Candidatus Helarchaeota archaeon]